MSAFEGSTSRVARNESFDSFASVDFLVESLPVEEEKEGKLEPSAMRLKELAGEIVEPLLAEDKNRFVLFPIKHHDVSMDSLFILRVLVLSSQLLRDFEEYCVTQLMMSIIVVVNPLNDSNIDVRTSL